MSRAVQSMTPSRIERRHIPSDLGQLLDPGEAEAPILTPSVQQAVHDWMLEIDARDDLTAAGLKPRTSALLEGLPGCGKTTLAHHIAARRSIPMLLVGAENLFAMYLGEAERNVARLFDAIEGYGDGILLFLDEIDAVGGRRIADAKGADNGRNSMLTVLLRRLERCNALIVGATNRPDSLDPALWRRFGLQIGIGLPGADERGAILIHYAAPYVFDIDLVYELVDRTDGASPALIRQLVEGMKRGLVLGPRRGRIAAGAEEAVAAVTAAIKPHPDYEPPRLWTAGLPAGLPWPPTREPRP